MSTQSMRPEPAIRAGAAIGKSLTIQGTITGREDLLVDGQVEGDVELPENRLTIGAGGNIHGGVRSKEIVVYGTVNGNLEATEKIEIKRNAKVVGDVRAARVVIEDESYFKGNVDTVKMEAPKPAVKAAATAAAPAPVAAPAPAAAPAAAGLQPSLLAGTADTKR